MNYYNMSYESKTVMGEAMEEEDNLTLVALNL
jgi:hypothetical protein